MGNTGPQGASDRRRWLDDAVRHGRSRMRPPHRLRQCHQPSDRARAQSQPRTGDSECAGGLTRPPDAATPCRNRRTDRSRGSHRARHGHLRGPDGGNLWRHLCASHRRGSAVRRQPRLARCACGLQRSADVRRRPCAGDTEFTSAAGSFAASRRAFDDGWSSGPAPAPDARRHGVCAGYAAAHCSGIGAVESGSAWARARRHRHGSSAHRRSLLFLRRDIRRTAIARHSGIVH